MAELLYNIKDVFEGYLNGVQKYNIPEYQRGYKWTSQQIYQLLRDINEFETNGDRDIFYCLQNITLVEKDGNINVVDGQQRLTTLTLILAYLKNFNLIQNKLLYSIRNPSNDFLQKITFNEDDFIQKIIDSKSFNEFINDNDYDYQDIFFMYNAVRNVDNWFKENTSVNKDSFTKKLLYHVKLIVNRIAGIEEQELFMNLNAGRVNLDGSDLVRAILITRVAKNEMEEFDSREIKNVVRLNERRIRIGWELDELNAWWSKKDVASYFSSFTSVKTAETETVKFNQEKHPINLLYMLWADIQPDNNKQIRLAFFESQNKNPLDLYISIIHLHRTLKDWYEDRQLYHYLGYLFSLRVLTFQIVWLKWNEKDITRKAFVEFLIEQMKAAVFVKVQTEDEDSDSEMSYWLKKIKDYESSHPTNWKGLDELQKILILLDVIEHAKEKINGVPLPYLKPQYFINYNEDEEHIYPSTPQDITEKRFKSLNSPMESICEYLGKLNQGYSDDLLILWDLDEHQWEKLTPEEKNSKLQLLRDQIHRKRPINSIGNLVLLHMSINRGFGNDYYSDKRLSVIKNTENGEYVRQHTLNVFVKPLESTDLNNWNMEDIKANADKIFECLNKFFDASKDNISHG